LTTLLVGFDSAWTAANSGGLVAVLRCGDGQYIELGSPRIFNYAQAEQVVRDLQAEHSPASTIILLDQPAIVRNAAGQRPVENTASSPVSLRFGGMQPANISRADMLRPAAPVWQFRAAFGGTADPLLQGTGTLVYEIYPVLALIAMEWHLPHTRLTGRLPKYNPERRRTFLLSDWQEVCSRAAGRLRIDGVVGLAAWCDDLARIPKPQKRDQDGLDACLCLLVSLRMAEGRECLMVGQLQTGYVVVPAGLRLKEELCGRCHRTSRVASQWVKTFRVSITLAATSRWSPGDLGLPAEGMDGNASPELGPSPGRHSAVRCSEFKHASCLVTKDAS
jgi:predicted RNase H-like nuclease